MPRSSRTARDGDRAVVEIADTGPAKNTRCQVRLPPAEPAGAA